MKKWLKILLIVIGVLVVLTVALFFFMRRFALDLVYHRCDAETRLVTETPAECGIPFEEVETTSEDGFRLVGWYIPSQDGAVIIAQHGYRGRRQNMLNDARILHQHGYGVLVTTVRAHDQSDGEMITLAGRR